MSAEYEAVSSGKLKLKTDGSMKKKKKKSKSKSKDKEKMEKALEENVTQPAATSGRKLTKAEQAFKQMQEKMQTKRILDKAKASHKQRVEKFNEHLDSLTEHFDIPKVSWTK